MLDAGCAVEMVVMELNCKQTGCPNHRAGQAASHAAIQAVRQVWGLNQLLVSEVRLESLKSKFKVQSHVGIIRESVRKS